MKEEGEIKISNNSDKNDSFNNNEKKENDPNKNDNKDEIINYTKKEEKKEGIKDIKKEDKEEKKEIKEDKEEIKEEVYEEDKKDNIYEQDNHKNENKENLNIDKNMVIQEEEKKSELEINESLKYIQKIFCIDNILNSSNIKLLKDVFKNLIYIKKEDDLFKTIKEKKFEAFIIILGLKQFPKYIDYINNNLMKLKNKDYNTFIQVLYKGLKEFEYNKNDILYRGTNISNEEIDIMINFYQNRKINEKNNIINNNDFNPSYLIYSRAYISFSKDKNKSLRFIKNIPNTKKILFLLQNDSKNKILSNAYLYNISAIPNEEEILFFPFSSFIIDQIEEKENIYYINLIYLGMYENIIKEKIKIIQDESFDE